MNSVKPLLPPISDADRTPLVDALLELLQWQSDRIEQLEDDIHRLNKQTRKPKFKSSKMNQQTEPNDGARHQGKTGYDTHIGNELFAWFESTESKSRVNFLELLSSGGCQTYVINAGALDYMQRQKLPKRLLESLETQTIKIETTLALDQWLDAQGISNQRHQRHQRILTEGILVGRLLDQGIPINLGIVSDDAGQFNVFDHALCWIHAERLITRLIPVNDLQKQAVNWARGEVWSIYAGLKIYKTAPNPAHATRLKAQFHQLVSTRTDYETLNQILKRMGNNQHELFRVLERPEIPLHNNLSERDIRDYLKKRKKRKISGSTRSEAGRQCRDTFASLKKTCRKHGISFWSYLLDRTSNANQIPSMADILQVAACG